MQEFASLHKSIFYSQSNIEYLCKLRKCTIFKNKKSQIKKKRLFMDGTGTCVAYPLLFSFFFQKGIFSLSYIGFSLLNRTGSLSYLLFHDPVNVFNWPMAWTRPVQHLDPSTKPICDLTGTSFSKPRRCLSALSVPFQMCRSVP